MTKRIGNGTLFALLLLAVFPLVACRSVGGVREPEQSALVSAVGVDADAGGVRLSLEVLMPQQEGGEGLRARVISATAADAETAYGRICAGLPREPVFAHCAVLVMGDGVSDDDGNALLRESMLPPEMQVVSAPDAWALLSLGSLSTPAAGYDLQAILARSPGISCRVYELLATGDGWRTALPRFLPAPAGCGRLVDLQSGDTEVTE